MNKFDLMNGNKIKISVSKVEACKFKAGWLLKAPGVGDSPCIVDISTGDTFETNTFDIAREMAKEIVDYEDWHKMRPRPNMVYEINGYLWKNAKKIHKRKYT